MTIKDETVLCNYQYDALDRLVDCTPSVLEKTQRFYLKDRLTNEIQGALRRSILQYKDQLLAQQQCEGDATKTTLLATDQQRSLLNEIDTTTFRFFTCTAYGHCTSETGLLSLLGFNGERPDPVTGHYLLGIGYRAFNPVLMRFNSPDSWSPFGKGGLNAYAYCVGDPVNRVDPTGHFGNPLKGLLNLFGRKRGRDRAQRVTTNPPAYAEQSAPFNPPSYFETDLPESAVLAPPPYTFERTSTPYDRMISQELMAGPPAYSRSQTNLVASPDTPRPMGGHSSSTPNLGLTLPNTQTRQLSAREGRTQHRINQLSNQRDWIRFNARNIPREQLGVAILDTLSNLDEEIRMLRGQM